VERGEIVAIGEEIDLEGVRKALWMAKKVQQLDDGGDKGSRPLYLRGLDYIGSCHVSHDAQLFHEKMVILLMSKYQ
jgi:hypothetical protein